MSSYSRQDTSPFLHPALQGFTISLYEWPQTVETLWDAVKGNILSILLRSDVAEQLNV